VQKKNRQVWNREAEECVGHEKKGRELLGKEERLVAVEDG
jgi:hypothetical protein